MSVDRSLSSQADKLAGSIAETIEDAPGGVLDWEHFVRIALYEPELGYYRRPDRARIGREPGTDFQTASSLNPVFASLVIEAATRLLPEGVSAAESRFIEIGAETPGGLLAGLKHPFREVLASGIEEALPVPDGPCILFSNELFDARPFRRYRFRDGAWREMGVALASRKSGRGRAPRPRSGTRNPGRGCTDRDSGGGDREESPGFKEAEVPPQVARFPAGAGEAPVDSPADPACVLPGEAPEGYRIDLSLEAELFLARLLQPGWYGLFLAFDYGKSWTVLANEIPEGTARAYHQHRQQSGLLERIGGQDLTCHVCWDRLAAILERNGFNVLPVERQESFILNRCPDTLQRQIAGPDAGQFSVERQALKALIHPAHFGNAFQVLHGVRCPA